MRLPPAGTVAPLSLSLAPLRAQTEDLPLLEDRVARMFDGDAAFGFNAGRSALTAVLRVMARTRSGDGVLIPAYTCYTVASAVVRAGLKIYPVDIVPETLDFNYRRRSDPPPKSVIAAISPGLFGIPCDLDVLKNVCRQSNLFMIEDAAQTLGSKVREKPTGRWGDATVFSYGRGKPLGGIGGGILIARGRALTQALRDDRMPERSPRKLRAAFRSAAGTVALVPWIFTVIRLLPFIRLGASIFDPEFEMAGMDPSVARLIHSMIPYLESIIEARIETGAELTARLQGTPSLLIPKPPEGSSATWLRFPVIFDDPADRDTVLYRLTSRGLGASTMYPKPIHMIEKAREYVRDDLRPFPGAERVARGILTLPTHARVTKRNLDEMARVIREATRAGAS